MYTKLNFILILPTVILIFYSLGISIAAEENKNEPNRLIHEKSPYLLQQAYYPVKCFSYTRIEAFLQRDLFPSCGSIRDVVMDRSFETYFHSLE